MSTKSYQGSSRWWINILKPAVGDTITIGKDNNVTWESFLTDISWSSACDFRVAVVGCDVDLTSCSDPVNSFSLDTLLVTVASCNDFEFSWYVGWRISSYPSNSLRFFHGDDLVGRGVQFWFDGTAPAAEDDESSSTAASDTSDKTAEEVLPTSTSSEGEESTLVGVADDNGGGGENKAGIIAGSVVGSVVFLVMAALIWYYRRRALARKGGGGSDDDQTQSRESGTMENVAELTSNEKPVGELPNTPGSGWIPNTPETATELAADDTGYQKSRLSEMEGSPLFIQEMEGGSIPTEWNAGAGGK
ncbi:hypothetical protein MKZ38_000143 [Zalerion maritima]|uniref:Uncharacterized protein n=1 Tax=Zalerion maritima TaxID=339359 RepID=A0AAD5RF95_9PEZI|nr:hypothetical protein MKZ38_000143 [Zalerion maritima]